MLTISINLSAIVWVMSILAVIGSFLNVRDLKSCFLVWTICNIFWVCYDIFKHEYARAVLDFINLITSTWGIIIWGKEIAKKRKK